MVLSPSQYATMFSKNGKVLNAESIKNRCRNNQLPSNHIPYKISNAWVIEILPNVMGFEELLSKCKPK